MYKIISVLILTAFSFGVNAQQYFPFVEEGKTWAELNIFQTPIPTYPIRYTTTSFMLEGDTLINDKIWKKYYTTRKDPQLGNWIFDYNFIREEDQKVYQYFDIITDVKLLYDFSLNLWDSLFIEDEGGFDYWIHVVNVDSVDINGTFRKRIQFGDPAETWIEGLGSTYCPFDPIYGQFLIGGGTYSLLCVSDPDGKVYQNPIYHSCFIDSLFYTSVYTSDKLSYEVNIIRNASQNETRVQISGPGGVFTIYQLFTINGMLVRQEKVPGNDFLLNTNGLNPGIYLMRLVGNKTTYNAKVEIIN